MFNKLKGALLGYIVGDALGVPVEFKERETLKKYPICEMVGYGTHHQPAGTWSDDTSMTLATMEWLMEGEDSTLQDNDLMDKFINWLTKGEYTAHGITFDYGNATAEALMRYTKGYQPYECGGTSAQSNGNGSLMRMLPIALRCAKNNLNEEELRQFVEKVSAFTHAHARSKMGCFLYVNIIMDLLKSDGDKKVIIQNSLNKCKAYYLHRNVEAELKELNHYERIFDVSLFQALPEAMIASSGYVVHTLEAALWCFLNTNSYHDCVLKAVNLGDDSDTVGAVAGSLAGLYDGIHAIPQEWIAKLAKKEWLELFINEFIEKG